VSTATDVLPATHAAGAQWRPSTRGWLVRLGVIVALLVLVVWRVWSIEPFWADRFALAAIYAIIGLSLNVVLGYTGQVSLGHHAFVGLSAFLSAFFVTERGQSFWIGLILATLMGAISAGLLGLVALRIRGLYLALITLTYGFVAVNSIFEIPALTRGGAGMPAPRPVEFASEHKFALLCFLFLGLVLFVDWRMMQSKVGRAILAVKQSEAVAASYAVNVTGYKVFGFMVSGAMAGLAGSLFAHRATTVVSADFSFREALIWVLMVVVGGLGNRTGVIIGSMFFALFPYLAGLINPLEHFVTDRMGRDLEELTLVIGPALALLTVIKYPGGIGEQISPITRWLSGHKFSLHPEGHKPKQKTTKKPRGTLLAKLRPGHGSASAAGNGAGDASSTDETQELSHVRVTSGKKEDV
jgi:branched-chain amino acid transport system permease protein